VQLLTHPYIIKSKYSKTYVDEKGAKGGKGDGSSNVDGTYVYGECLAEVLTAVDLTLQFETGTRQAVSQRLPQARRKLVPKKKAHKKPTPGTDSPAGDQLALPIVPEPAAFDHDELDSVAGQQMPPQARQQMRWFAQHAVTVAVHVWQMQEQQKQKQDDKAGDAAAEEDDEEDDDDLVQGGKSKGIYVTASASRMSMSAGALRTIAHHFASLSSKLALAYWDSSDATASLKWLQQSLVLSRRVHGHGANHVDIAISLHSIGVLLRARGQFEEALTTLKEALAMGKVLQRASSKGASADATSSRTEAVTGGLVGVSLRAIAMTLRAQGRFSHALSFLSEALDLEQLLVNGAAGDGAHDTSGGKRSQSSVLLTLSLMSEVHRSNSNLEEALQCMEHCLRIQKEEVGLLTQRQQSKSRQGAADSATDAAAAEAAGDCVDSETAEAMQQDSELCGIATMRGVAVLLRDLGQLPRAMEQLEICLQRGIRQCREWRRTHKVEKEKRRRRKQRPGPQKRKRLPNEDDEDSFVKQLEEQEAGSDEDSFVKQLEEQEAKPKAIKPDAAEDSMDIVKAKPKAPSSSSSSASDVATTVASIVADCPTRMQASVLLTLGAMAEVARDRRDNMRALLLLEQCLLVQKKLAGGGKREGDGGRKGGRREGSTSEREGKFDALIGGVGPANLVMATAEAKGGNTTIVAMGEMYGININSAYSKKLLLQHLSDTSSGKNGIRPTVAAAATLHEIGLVLKEEATGQQGGLLDVAKQYFKHELQMLLRWQATRAKMPAQPVHAANAATGGSADGASSTSSISGGGDGVDGVPCIGMRVKVKFEDGQWYGGYISRTKLRGQLAQKGKKRKKAQDGDVEEEEQEEEQEEDKKEEEEKEEEEDATNIEEMYNARADRQALTNLAVVGGMSFGPCPERRSTHRRSTNCQSPRAPTPTGIMGSTGSVAKASSAPKKASEAAAKGTPADRRQWRLQIVYDDEEEEATDFPDDNGDIQLLRAEMVSLQVADCLHALGSVLQAQGDFDGAEDYLEQALVMKKQIFAPTHTFFCANAPQPQEAATKEKGKERGKKGGWLVAHPSVSTTLHALGLVLHAKACSQEELHQSIFCLQQALLVCTACFEISDGGAKSLVSPPGSTDTVIADHPSGIASQHHLGLVYKDLRLVDDAHKAFSTALSQLEHRVAPHLKKLLKAGDAGSGNDPAGYGELSFTAPAGSGIGCWPLVAPLVANLQAAGACLKDKQEPVTALLYLHRSLAWHVFCCLELQQQRAKAAAQGASGAAAAAATGAWDGNHNLAAALSALPPQQGNDGERSAEIASVTVRSPDTVPAPRPSSSSPTPTRVAGSGPALLSTHTRRSPSPAPPGIVVTPAGIAAGPRSMPEQQRRLVVANATHLPPSLLSLLPSDQPPLRFPPLPPPPASGGAATGDEYDYRIAIGFDHSTCQHPTPASATAMATTLHTVAGCLSDLGRRRDALWYLKQALSVERRGLSADQEHSAIPPTPPPTPPLKPQPSPENPQLLVELEGGVGSTDAEMHDNDESVAAPPLKRRRDEQHPPPQHPHPPQHALTNGSEAGTMTISSGDKLAITDTSFAAATLHTMGALMRGEGLLPQALSALQRSLAMQRRIYGMDAVTPSISATVHELGSVLRLIGKYEEAFKHLKQALSMSKKLLGSKSRGNIVAHPEIASTMGEMGATLHLQGLNDKAIKWLEASLTAFRQVYEERCSKEADEAEGEQDSDGAGSDGVGGDGTVDSIMGTLELLGDVCIAKADLKGALKYKHQALAVAQMQAEAKGEDEDGVMDTGGQDEDGEDGVAAGAGSAVKSLNIAKQLRAVGVLLMALEENKQAGGYLRR
jgi:tetratricopeptide (TPR) repeat protein